MSDAEPNTEIDVDPAEAEALMARGAMLVDVRQPEEWEAGRIPGATHIEVAELSARAAELPSDRPLIFACKSGSRSSFAVQAFREAGYDARNLDGGVLAWVDSGRGLEPEGGEVVAPLPAPR